VEAKVYNGEKGAKGATANTVVQDQGNKKQKISANLRIGAHNKDILSILFGSLLGDAQAEFKLKGNGTRISFYQEGSHVSYLIWLHKFLSELGYCNTNLPKITTRLGKKGVVRKIIIFNT
jgi:ubiquinol-cytochrome c reductase cytochrome b subunit